jgi:hypothetical protein
LGTHTILAEDRRILHNHRLRGLPAFWIGFFITALSFLGMLARLEGIPGVRSSVRSVLSAIPPGGSFYREHLYFQFQSAPFASIATLAGLALLVWGAVELIGASRIKNELLDAEEERRKRQIVRELEAEEKADAGRSKGTS